MKTLKKFGSLEVSQCIRQTIYALSAITHKYMHSDMAPPIGRAILDEKDFNMMLDSKVSRYINFMDFPVT